MVKTLIVIESPNKTKSIANLINNNASLWPMFFIDNINELKVVSTKGHFLGLNYRSSRGFSIQNNTLIPHYAFLSTERRTEINNTITKHLKEAQNIFIATDNDNEGELIGNEVLSLLNRNEWTGKTFHRIRITEITASGLMRAINNSENRLNTPMVNSAIARGVWDLEFGFTLSQLLREEIKKKGNNPNTLPSKYSFIPKIDSTFVNTNKQSLTHLGSGRVKAYILEEIGNRSLAVRTFKQKQWYTLNPRVNGLVFNHINTKLDYALNQNSSIIFEDITNARRAINDIGNQAQCTNIAPTRHTISKPAEPLVLSDVPFGMLSNGIKSQLEISQFLFEAGLTTYPRSPYRTISQDFIDASFKPWDEFLKNYVNNNPSLNNQLYAILPDKKFIAGTPENQAYLKQQDKKTKNKEQADDEPQNAHECYRVVDLMLDNASMLIKCIDHKINSGDAGFENVRSVIESNRDEINRNDTLFYLINQYPNNKYLYFLNDCIKFYAEIRNGTRAVFTNPPEYDKSDITIQSIKTKSDDFKANISIKTKVGYDYVPKIIKQEENQESNENTDDNDNSNNLNNNSINNILSAFVLNNVYNIENFNIVDENAPNSILKRRVSTKPKLLTQQEVINLLKKNDIGTEATRAGTLKMMSNDDKSIIKTIKTNRGYELDLLPLGMVVWEETRTQCPEVVKKEWTSKFDEKLTDIENDTYTKDELIMDLVNEMSKPPYKDYNWYVYGNDIPNPSRWPGVTKTISELKCVFCNEFMKETEIRYMCDNLNCPSYVKETYDKYHFNWTITKAKIIKGSMCINHPTIPMCKSKSGKPFCPVDMLINEMVNLESFKSTLQPKYVDSGIQCPSCLQNMLSSVTSILCKNPNCPLGYNETYKCSWGFNKQNIIRNQFCPKHPAIPMCRDKKGKAYCPYEFILNLRAKNNN